MPERRDERQPSSTRWHASGLVFLMISLAVLVCGCTSTSRVVVTPPVHVSQAPDTPISMPSLTVASGAPTVTRGASRETSGPRPTARPSSTPPPPEPTLPEYPAVVRTIPLSDLVAASLGPSDLVLMGGRVYVTNSSSDSVAIIEGRQVVQVVPVGHGPSEIVAEPDAGRLYVLSERDSSVSVIEQGRVVDTWVLPSYPTTMWLAGGSLWVGTMDSQVLIVSTADGSHKATLQLSQRDAIFGAALSVDGASVYASSFDHLYVLGTDPPRELAAVEIDGYRNVGSLAGGRAFIGGYDSELGDTFLNIVDAETLELIDRVPIPSGPGQSAVHPDSGRIYVPVSESNELLAIDAETLEIVDRTVVGHGPRSVIVDSAAGTVYVANELGDSVALLDADDLSLLDVIPLSVTVAEIAVDPSSGLAYLAARDLGKVLVVDAEGVRARWSAGRHPHHVALIPSLGRLAVVSLIDGSIYLLDRESGEIAESYATGRRPRGLMVNEEKGHLIAGDTLVNWGQKSTYSLSLETGYALLESEVPPVQMVLDTRRQRLYAVHNNGIPGSNGGHVVSRWASDPEARGAAKSRTPGRLSIIDLVYDEGLDRFYATNSRMGQFGVQVSQGEDGQEVHYVLLEHYPEAMALNAGTHHLWIALTASGTGVDGRMSQLVAFDTRTMDRVVELEIPGMITAMAVDPARDLVHVATGGTGALHTVQDVSVPLPVWAKVLEALPALPTPTASPTPTCSILPDSRVSTAWAIAGGVPSLGCAVGLAQDGDWATQAFERGAMYWHGEDRSIFVVSESGQYATFADSWREDMPEASCLVSAPSGLSQPVRGFGLVWCRETGVREMVGWAMESETGFRGTYQRFAWGGILLGPDDRGLVLRSDGRWETQ